MRRRQLLAAVLGFLPTAVAERRGQQLALAGAAAVPGPDGSSRGGEEEALLVFKGGGPAAAAVPGPDGSSRGGEEEALLVFEGGGPAAAGAEEEALVHGRRR